MAKRVKNVFNDINPNDRYPEPERKDRPDLGDFKQMSIGEGDKVFRGDKDGLWMGAKSFATAPWRVDMNGNMYMKASSRDGYVMINATTASITVHDGVNARVQIGGI